MNKRKAITMIIAFGGLLFIATSIWAVVPVSSTEYLRHAQASADWTWQHYDELIKKWQQGFDPENIFGYRPPGGLLEMAVIDSERFAREGKEEYARRAKKVLLGYGDFRSLYPDAASRRRSDYSEGVPALPDFFTAMRYIRAYDTLRRRGALSPGESERISATIAQSMNYLLQTQEWGAMNRAMLRAESLAWAVKALPLHPQRPVWEMLRQSLGGDNWGHWEIEDATIYHGVWLYSLLGYADALGRMRELFQTPEIYYYAQYFLNLLSPDGAIPDFGDAHWQSSWAHFLVFFETAAAQYQDPRLKWAAATIARRFLDLKQNENVGLGYMLLDCARWGSDRVSARPPDTLSAEVMEDVQGKKIVFRDGWKEASTYLLLNYRDEGDGGLNFRDYLRDTIPVEEEKMTHGHADENSIVLLMSDGSVLLHDGGYRDYMPSGPFGAYRQDYFHNRLCVRQEKIWMGQEKGQSRYGIRDGVPGQSVLDFLHNAGSYRRVQTQKQDFLSLPDIDYSRTRLIDDSLGYEWDRLITYLKELNLFAVFDIFKARRSEFFTMANLWHTRQIAARGEHWYDTRYDRIADQPLPDRRRLLIIFPHTHFRLEGVEPEKRHFQDEWLIHQTGAQHFELGATTGFVTLLIPHAPDEPPTEWVSAVRPLVVEPQNAALGVEIRRGGRVFVIAAKTDLRRGMDREWRRPRYTYETGKIRVGDFETDGDFLFARLLDGKLNYTVVNVTKMLFRNRTLLAAKSNNFGLAFDGSPDSAGIGKLRYWREEVAVSKE